jgi:formylglycine-generating enzyme required for sulfatase activity
MNPLHYLDFDLKFTRKEADGFLLSCRSPAGEAAEAFHLPFAPLETENLILKLSRLKRAGRAADSPELAAARKLGGGLFEAIFQGQVRDCFRASLEKICVQPHCGLRLKLRLQDAPKLADLPWEYLHDHAFGRFLAQSVQTPIVRYLELPEGIRPLKTALPLRILGLISSPLGYATLDTAREKELVEQAVAPLISQGLAELDWLPKADLSTLRTALRREQHILHFIGHGGVGELLLEDGRGKGRPVSGEVLGVLLHDCHSLRLAVLNSCEGARSGPEDPFAGVAAALVRQGLPAVAAMQFEISDNVAIEFAKEFYEALVSGFPVDAAMAEARKAVLCLGSMEWGTPVLHLRADNGVLFELPEATERKPEPAKSPESKSAPAARKAESATGPKQGDTMIDPITGIKFVYIPGGCFMMGSPPDEEGHSADESPVHKVCVDAFWMGKYLVTQSQWQQIMGNNPSCFPKGGTYPIEHVSWVDTQEFIKKLNSLSGKTFRLPTEAEWEYACRAGSSGKWYSDNLDAIAWYQENSGVHPVGEKEANAFGLHDMLGNLWEWCADQYDSGYYASSPQNNPAGPKSSGMDRVIRGGLIGGHPGKARAAFRSAMSDSVRFFIGFRLVLPAASL